MGEPAAVSYSDVLKGHKDDTSAATAAWRKIGEVTGAGNVYPGELASIDLTDAKDDVRAKVKELTTAKAAAPAGSGTAPASGGGN